MAAVIAVAAIAVFAITRSGERAGDDRTGMENDAATSAREPETGTTPSTDVGASGREASVSKEDAPGSRAARRWPTLEAAIHLKSLAYDRSLAGKSGERLIIAVVHADGDPAATGAAEDMTAAFSQLAEKIPVRGRAVSARLVSYRPASFAADLAAIDASALYLTAGLDDSALVAISRSAVDGGLPTLAGSRSLAVSGAAAIAVFPKGNRSALAINLESARAMGMSLDESILAIAEVIH